MNELPVQAWECGDCGGAVTPGLHVPNRQHLDDGSPVCMGRRDAVRRKPGHFCCLECGQPPDQPHDKRCPDPSGRSGGRVA